jgi:ubiquinone/menaquinone biosynthesis C-methylase UbiE
MKLLLEFKEKFPFISDPELTEYYRRIIDVPINMRRKTDLNKACVDYILKSVDGSIRSVLDVGCGSCYLLDRIMSSNPGVMCEGVDFAARDAHPQGIGGGMSIKIHESDMMELPFQDHLFDLVLCTHVLEHLRDPQKALAELVRVARRRLIVVCPCQREYKYTIDFHVNFFPYMYAFKRFIGIENAVYLRLNGDFLCCVDFDR